MLLPGPAAITKFHLNLKALYMISAGLKVDNNMYYAL